MALIQRSLGDRRLAVRLCATRALATCLYRLDDPRSSAAMPWRSLVRTAMEDGNGYIAAAAVALHLTHFGSTRLPAAAPRHLDLDPDRTRALAANPDRLIEALAAQPFADNGWQMEDIVDALDAGGKSRSHVKPALLSALRATLPGEMVAVEPAVATVRIACQLGVPEARDRLLALMRRCPRAAPPRYDLQWTWTALMRNHPDAIFEAFPALMPLVPDDVVQRVLALAPHVPSEMRSPALAQLITDPTLSKLRKDQAADAIRLMDPADHAAVFSRQIMFEWRDPSRLHLLRDAVLAAGAMPQWLEAWASVLSDPAWRNDPSTPASVLHHSSAVVSALLVRKLERFPELVKTLGSLLSVLHLMTPHTARKLVDKLADLPAGVDVVRQEIEYRSGTGIRQPTQFTPYHSRVRDFDILLRVCRRNSKAIPSAAALTSGYFQTASAPIAARLEALMDPRTRSIVRAMASV